MENKKIYQIIGTLVILAIIIVGVYFLAKGTSKDESSSTTTKTEEGSDSEDVLSIREGDWLKGNRDAKVVIIEYSDFQCPACGFATDSLKKLLIKYPNDIAVVYRHFPLSYHEYAFKAAKATEIAGETGKFFAMHDLLFDNQEELNEEKILELAESLGFNKSDFEKKMTEKTYEERVYADLLEAQDLKVDHTPFFYIKGKEYEGNLDLDSLEEEVKKYL